MFPEPIRQQAALRYKQGASVALLCAEIGCSQETLKQWAKKYVGSAMRRPNPKRKNRVASPISAEATRDQDILVSYQSGLTLQKIGDIHGITRERVRQIVKKAGVLPTDGGIAVKVAMKRKKKAALRELKMFQKYGLTVAEWREVGAKARRAYVEHRRDAKYRGIKFSLTLAEWWDIWNRSGKWLERGRTKAGYCMSRINDAGGYVPGNVHITSTPNNCREARNGRGKRKEATFARGVYMLYPGAAKPFVAKYGNEVIGWFQTGEEALAARNAWLLANNKLGPRGRGYTYDSKVQRWFGRPGGKHIGTFKTEADAQRAVAEYYASKAAA